jgi:hypothetical protein
MQGSLGSTRRLARDRVTGALLGVGVPVEAHNKKVERSRLALRRPYMTSSPRDNLIFVKGRLRVTVYGLARGEG